MQFHIVGAEADPAMDQIAWPALEAVVSLNPCQAPPPVPVVTTVAPVHEHQSLCLTAAACLYALNAVDGTVRWGQQVQLTRPRAPTFHPLWSSPPPPRTPSPS